MAGEQLRPISSGTRRRFIDYIVNKTLGFDQANLWQGEADNPTKRAYREWARSREPSLRAELKAKADDALRAAHDEAPALRELLAFLSGLGAEQRRSGMPDPWMSESEYGPSHRDVSRKGGQAHSRSPDIIAAIQDMYARNPKVQAKQAYHTLSATGRIINGKPARGTFDRHYWPLRKVEKSDSKR